MSLLSRLPRFRDLDRSLEILRGRETWSRDAIQSHQLDRINEIWDHARRHVPHYRQLASRSDMPDRFESLEHYRDTMPLLSKQCVRDNSAAFHSEEAAVGSWHRTGGSTGHPTAVYWSNAAHREMLRAKYRCEQSYGVSVFDRKVFLWGHSGSFAPGLAGWVQRLRRPVEDRLRHRLRLSAYDLDRQHLVAAARRMQAFDPISIYGYSSAVLLLSQVATEEGIRFKNLRLATMTAEPADEPMVERVSEQFGCQCSVEYGSVECGLMAYRMPDGRIRTRDDMNLIETVRCGDRYEIVVTVLNNPSFPLMRYRIQDTTSEPRQSEDHGFGWLHNIQGRANDMLVTAGGRRLHSMAVKHVLEHWPEIRRFTAKQSGDGQLSILLETPDPVSKRFIDKLQQRLETMLEGYGVKIETTPSIPGNRAGKHRWIISDLAVKDTAQASDSSRH